MAVKLVGIRGVRWRGEHSNLGKTSTDGTSSRGLDVNGEIVSLSTIQASSFLRALVLCSVLFINSLTWSLHLLI